MFSLHKQERICSKKQINRLYEEGTRFRVFPYSVTWLLIDRTPVGECTTDTPSTDEPAMQVLFVAPKRFLRHAVDRNRAKRLTRECYRLQKHALCDRLKCNKHHLLLALSYNCSQLLDYSTLMGKMEKIIIRINHELDS